MSSPEVHAPLAADGTCWTCHGEDYAGGSAGVACSSCHVTYPHPGGWAGQEHMSAVGSLGEAACMRCHAPGDGPDEMIASCAASCHGGAF